MSQISNGAGVGSGGVNPNTMLGNSFNTGSNDENVDSFSRFMNFDQEIKVALLKLQGGGSFKQVDVDEDLINVDRKEPMTEKEVDEVSDKFFDHAKRILSQGPGVDVNSVMELQKALLGLFMLVEEYASKESTTQLADLWKELPENHGSKEKIEGKFVEWSRIEVFAFGAMKDTEILKTEEGKLEKTREIQYQMYISIQVFSSGSTELAEKVGSTHQVKDSVEKYGINNGDNIVNDAVVSDDDTAVSEGASQQQNIVSD